VTAPFMGVPISARIENISKKMRVLLLDTSQTKRDLRADVMRRLGIEVDCAADVIEARGWWRADLYNLVLINSTGEAESSNQFCTEIRGANPTQRVAFFVGSPQYLAAAPHSDAAPAEMSQDALCKEMIAALLAQSSENPSQRWGILEACKRISSVRSVSEARSRALRETPRPSRWAEAIERHTGPDTHSQPAFAAALTTEREEIL
jgi:hypothetical protein